MPLLRRFYVAWLLGGLICAATSPTAQAASLKALHRFTNTGTSTKSQFALGATPYSELVQASDGNFYGTTTYGGAGNCPSSANSSDVLGCGTVFRMTPGGTVSALYSFPYNGASKTAVDGAFPVAGLVQGQDGYLYGVASDGGRAGDCNGDLGCGTLFRISTMGSFTLLHKFCVGDKCPPKEGGRPLAHLIQLPDQSLCGTTSQGGYQNEGTVFCASTAGGVGTLYDFHYENGVDGYNPVAALLASPDGGTLYGTTAFGGANGGGTVFSITGKVMTVLHTFDSNESSAAGTYYFPEGALIFGADGGLYGTTYSGGSGGGCIFALKTDGSGFTAKYDFDANASSNAPGFPVAGLVLARDGMMYGTTLFGSIEQTFGLDNGIAYRYDPATGTVTRLADFNTTVGSKPRAALIEGTDKFLYGSASTDGGSNKRGTDEGTLVRLSPALKQ